MYESFSRFSGDEAANRNYRHWSWIQVFVVCDVISHWTYLSTRLQVLNLMKICSRRKIDFCLSPMTWCNPCMYMVTGFGIISWKCECRKSPTFQSMHPWLFFCTSRCEEEASAYHSVDVPSAYNPPSVTNSSQQTAASCFRRQKSRKATTDFGTLKFISSAGSANCDTFVESLFKPVLESAE